MKKAAIVGCGRMGAFTSEGVLRHAPKCWLPLSHAESVLAHGDLEIAALADTDSVMLQRAATHYGVARTYTDFNALIAENSLDLLCLATRTPGRAAMIAKACQAGVMAIHAEKPLCNSTQELRDLAMLFARNDFHFTWGAIRRHLPAYRQAMEMVLANEYGSLVEIRVNFGAAPLFWTHAHSFDLITFIANNRRVESIHAKLRAFKTLPGKTLYVESDPIIEYCVMTFDDGVNGLITQSLGADLILTCKRGEIWVTDDGASIHVRRYSSGGYTEVINIPIRHYDTPVGTLAPITMLIDCLAGVDARIQNNRRIKNDIIQSQRLMFASVLSHAEKGMKVTNLVDMPEIEIRAMTNGQPA
jgi:scyllo-inositol 2-dehydrogenase (NAD+)